MAQRRKIIKELHAMNNVIRGFCESFDCEDLPCDECPIGYDVCFALGKRNIELKYPSNNR